jgi:hypothetical protein
VDAPTIELQQQALAQLQQMLDAAAPPQDGPPNDSERGDDQNPRSDSDGPTNGSRESSPYLLAELQLLHAWQVDLNRRTEELAGGQFPKDRPVDPRSEARAELAVEQLRLAEIVEKLLLPAGQADPTIPPAPTHDGLAQLDELLRTARGGSDGP